MDRFKSLILRLRDPRRVNPNERDEWAAEQIEILREVVLLAVSKIGCDRCRVKDCNGGNSVETMVLCEDRKTAWLFGLADERIDEKARGEEQRLAGEAGDGGTAAEDASAPGPAPAGSL